MVVELVLIVRAAMTNLDSRHLTTRPLDCEGLGCSRERRVEGAGAVVGCRLQGGLRVWLVAGAAGANVLEGVVLLPESSIRVICSEICLRHTCGLVLSPFFSLHDAADLSLFVSLLRKLLALGRRLEMVRRVAVGLLELLGAEFLYMDEREVLKVICLRLQFLRILLLQATAMIGFLCPFY